MAVNYAGNVYVAGDNAIRTINNGVVSTVVGGTIPNPIASEGLAVNTAGNLFVADRGNSLVSEYMAGSLVTVAASSQFSVGLWGIAVDPDSTVNGTIYVTDEGNQTIHKLSLPTVPAQINLLGTSSVFDSANLTGLAPNTTYYYRVVATSPGGETYGTIKSFTTPALVFPTSTTLQPTGVTATSATFQANVNPNGVTTNANFIYSTNPDAVTGGQGTPVQALGRARAPVPISTTVTGLMPNTTYYVLIGAGNTEGDSTDGNIVSFTTLPAVAPTATTSQQVASISATEATVFATFNPEGSDTTVYFEYGTDPTLTNDTTMTTDGLDIGSGTADVQQSALLHDLLPGTTYYFQAVATNAAGTIDGKILSFTTSAALPIVTTTPVSAVTTTTATVGGTADPEGGATTVEFVFGTNPSLSSGTATTMPLGIGSGTGVHKLGGTLTGLSPGTTYYFRLQATNSAGTTKGAIFSFTTTAAPPPLVRITSLQTPTITVTTGMGKKAKKKSEMVIDLQFSGAINGAAEPRRLPTPVRHDQKGGHDLSRRVPLALASFNTGTNSLHSCSRAS